MKPIIKCKNIVATGIAALTLTPVFAIEAPADNTPPPPPAKPADAHAAPGHAKVEVENANENAKAFLGVLTTEIPDMVAEHLDLKPGAGVAVKSLAPDGPAAKAGMKPNDIITRIGDEDVSSQADLVRIVQAKNPGDQIHLETIQKGKAKGLDVTLGLRPPDADAPDDPMMGNLPLDGFPKEMADRIRGAIKGNIGGIELKFHDLLGDDAQLEDLNNLRKKMEKMGNIKEFRFQGGGGFQSSSKMADENGSVELKSNKDGKEAIVRDPDDKITWSGPWDTEQDKAAAPPEIRARIDALNMGKFNMKGGMFEQMLEENPDAPEDNEMPLDDEN